MDDNKYTPEELTCLPRDELRRILTEELHKPTTEIDDALVRALMAELRSRGADPSFVDDAAVEQVCTKFNESTQKAQPHRKHWYQSWMLKVASIVLVLGVLFFALPGAAQADDVTEVLGWWSDSVFQFFTPGKQPNIHIYVYETDHPGLQQIYDTVTELGIADPIVPRWVPDGFELTELKVHQMLDCHIMHARMIGKDHQLLISFVANNDNTKFQHEKDEDAVNIWELAGYEHYLVSNNSQQIVTWLINGIECTITTDCPEEDVYRIVKSIYTSED